MLQKAFEKYSWRRSLGGGLIVLGGVVLFTPFVAGTSIVGLLGIILLLAGLAHFADVVQSRNRPASLIAYGTGVAAVLFGLVLFFSPRLALSGTLAALTLIVLANAAAEIHGSLKLSGAARGWGVANGLFSVVLAVLIWLLVGADLGVIAIGVTVGLWLVVEGWTRLFMPEKRAAGTSTDELDVHPDPGLAIGAVPVVSRVNQEIRSANTALLSENISWSLTILTILFAIHFIRTDARWSFIGLISPFTAVIGDALVALLLGVVLILPVRLGWRKLTRPVERAAWQRLQEIADTGSRPSYFERFVGLWVRSRMLFAYELATARISVNFAFWRFLGFGLPLTAVLVAVNSIWGFSWYFNSENWASAVYQEMTKTRVDTWRKRGATDSYNAAIAAGISPAEVFAVSPGEISEGDFSFLIIGDTGEGDQSQMVLRDRILKEGSRDDVKFLILSSDVIYPNGRMSDYEEKFYLPFKGFQKPIYAVPGNHDWFDANEGFNANFLEPVSAELHLRGRLAEDLGTDAISTDDRFESILSEARRLREYYGVRNGHQRAPFFEIHTPGLSVIAADTGILRTLDVMQAEWLGAALQRAGANFKLVILGHPFYVAGKYTARDDEEFSRLHSILREHRVDAVMAGDTHDFEHYLEGYKVGGESREMMHFVNGGGGAYLSIGAAIGFPADPDILDYAVYPRGMDVTSKIKSEASWLRMPFFYWMQWLQGWPFDQEMVSGAFDFNRAPFFQSFVEVKVSRSENRVSFVVHGANGALLWRDIQTGGKIADLASSPDEIVRFTRPLSGGK